MKLTDLVKLNEAEVDAAFLQKVKAALSKAGAGDSAVDVAADDAARNNSGKPLKKASQTGDVDTAAMFKEMDRIISKATDPIEITSAFVELPQKYGKRDQMSKMFTQKKLIGYVNKKYLGGDANNFKLNTRQMAQKILSNKPSSTGDSAADVAADDAARNADF